MAVKVGSTVSSHDRWLTRARRKELILEDDPGFELNPILPAFHFDDDGNLVVPQGSQSSRKTSSQLSPLQTDGSLLSSNRSILSGFDLSQSPFGRGNSIIAEPFGAGTMTLGKEDDRMIPFGDEERELQALDDWGIEIDAEGNVIPFAEEPQLPQLPQLQDQEGADPMQQDQVVIFDDQGDVIMGGEELFRSDPPLPVQQGQEKSQGQEQEQEVSQEHGEQQVTVEEASSGQAPVRAQRQRRRPVLVPDDQTKITREELKSWSANYLANAEHSSQRRHGTTIAEARKNAFDLVFGRGIAGVGFATGVPGLPHPLAPHFAGEGLQACLLGIIITHPDGEAIEALQGRRRTALEALELEQEDAERRVRRKLNDDDDDDEDAQHAQPQPLQDDELPFGDDDLPPVEVGRRAGSILPDIPSDVPWNRPSSQIPSSSVKGAAGGSLFPGNRQVSASPLHRRGGSLLIPGPEIERFSDDDDDAGGGGFAALHSGPDGSFPSDSPIPNSQTTPSQQMRSALDREGRNFLTYVESVARDKGHASPSPSPSLVTSPKNNNNNSHSHSKDVVPKEERRKWIEFDALFTEQDQKRAVVAQAFYHVLSLASKSVLKVRQEGQGGREAFGAIRLGVEVSSSLAGGDDNDEGNGNGNGNDNGNGNTGVVGEGEDGMEVDMD